MSDEITVTPVGAPALPAVAPAVPAAPETPAAEGATPAIPETPPAGEGAPPAEPAPTEDPSLASRFAALSRRDKELRERENALKAQEATVKATQEQIQAIADLKELGKENPMAVMEEYGITFDQLTQFILNDGKKTPEEQIAELSAQVEELKKTPEQIRKEIEEKELERQKSQVETRIDFAKSQLNSFIDSQSEQFPLLVAQKAHDRVWNVVEEYFYETSTLIDFAQAAQAVEDELIDGFKKFQGIDKVASLFAPKTPDAQELIPAPAQASSRPVVKTISNQHAGPAITIKPKGPMSDSERLAAAASKLRFVTPQD